MIHYILLPSKERKALQREYRIRLAILMMLFASISIMVGILCLLPSYLHISNAEDNVLSQKMTLLQSRKDSGGEEIQKSLLRTQVIAEKVLSPINSQPLLYEDILQKIIVLKKKDVVLRSMSMSLTQGTSTVASVVVLGQATTRESLLDFKTQLENNPIFAEVTLPLSDLAKSREVSFSLTFKVKKH